MASTMLHEKRCNTVLQIGAPVLLGVKSKRSCALRADREKMLQPGLHKRSWARGRRLSYQLLESGSLTMTPNGAFPVESSLKKHGPSTSELVDNTVGLTLCEWV